MYYKYFIEKTTWDKIKQIIVFALKSIIYGLALTIIIALIIGYRPVYIIGDSMTPEILKHDVIIIRPVKADEIKVDDVITYTGGASGKGLTTHRIYGIEDGYYYTKDEPTVLEWKEAGKTFSEVKSRCEQISYDRVKGEYLYRFIFIGDCVEFLTTEKNAGATQISIPAIISVLLTIIGCYVMIKIYKQQDDKYEM